MVEERPPKKFRRSPSNERNVNEQGLSMRTSAVQVARTRARRAHIDATPAWPRRPISQILDTSAVANPPGENGLDDGVGQQSDIEEEEEEAKVDARHSDNER